MTTTNEHEHADGCLMCAVRALTEGDPAATWTPEREGATISGVVLRMGELPTNFGMIPFVDLWLGGTSRVRVKAYGAQLRDAIKSSAPLVGDRLSVWFDGERTIPANGRHRELTYRSFSVNVQRGH
jgi:hypothetical protein